ncbi:MAG: helix-turn-helix transcriptional regulator [Phaeodactylibacter sp.]|uniref:helix-turn-helix transcriptional regulator n=1 Tax=Phaeodactylibacter sp. TaxID=1940289 RepID=UPI0032EC7E3A
MSNTRKEFHSTFKKSLPASNHSTSAEDVIWLGKVRRKVEKQLSSPSLTVDEIATQMLMSERQFYRKVKKASRLTPNQLIQRWRLERAKKILDAGQVQSTSHLANLVGYAKTNYFSRLFESRYGFRPSQSIDVF